MAKAIEKNVAFDSEGVPLLLGVVLSAFGSAALWCVISILSWMVW